MIDFELLHTRQNIEQTVEVVAVIKQRLLNRFADRFEGSEVNNAFNIGIFKENTPCFGSIAKVNVVILDPLARNGFNAV